MALGNGEGNLAVKDFEGLLGVDIGVLKSRENSRGGNVGDSVSVLKVKGTVVVADDSNPATSIL